MEAEDPNCKFKKIIQYFHFGTTIHFYDNVILFLNQSDVDFIKKSKYITDRSLGVIFWSGNLLLFTLIIFDIL